ncbi:MAG: restriction endonuclease [Candidatus Hodarchaeota archaeon]
MMERYRGIIASIIATMLRESKDNEDDDIAIEELRDLFTPGSEDGIDIEDLLEYISNSTDGSILIIKKGGRRVARMTDKISLYLMLHQMNYNLATTDLLRWQDFEKLVKYALEENGFITKNNFRFKSSSGKRYEIDVIAIDKLSKEHLIMLVDAKHWDFRTNSSASRIVEAANAQFDRAVALGDSKKVLADLFFDLKLEWNDALLLPCVTTLLPPPVQNFSIPIVSILSFNSFILDFSENMGFFKKKIVKNIPIQKKLL